VGNDGETLVADSSTSTGLRWQGNYAAGVNEILNSDYSIWQRGTTFNSIATGTYTADRWAGLFINGTCNVTQQAFTAGTAPVSGYESQYFLRLARTSTAGTADFFGQKIEDVRTFAGQTATISFWAKCSTASANGIIFYLSQNFGSGGSGSVDISPSTTTGTVTTSWTRYTATFTVPSITGKTIGTGSNLQMVFAFPTAHGNVSFDIWGVQVEAGSVATPFRTATGTIQGELAACQRYYWRQTGESAYSVYAMGANTSTTACNLFVQFPQIMRTSPSAVEYSTLALQEGNFAAVLSVTALGIDSLTQSTRGICINATVASGLTQFRPSRIEANNSTSAYIGFSAEL
jgi:hypothetical protein